MTVSDISGTVLDATGATVPGAKVTVSNPSKGVTREMETNGSGIFNAPSLVPAAGYEIHVKKQGFSNYEAKGIDVAVGDWVNDVPMFEVAGRSFAMGMAPDAVRAKATDVLDRPAGSGGGIAEAIRRAWG